ncbi:MAG: hypothetical protein ACR2GE_04870 [Pseudonocardia sp.]
MMIRYTVRPDQVGRNLKLLRAVYEELESTQPDGLHQASFQLDDKITFVDFVMGPDLPEPLPRLEAFQRFRRTLDARYDEPPVMTELSEVGSFRFH